MYVLNRIFSSNTGGLLCFFIGSVSWKEQYELKVLLEVKNKTQPKICKLTLTLD